MSARRDLAARVVEQRGLVTGDRPPARARSLLVEGVGEEDVQCLGRADAVEHGMAEALAEPPLQLCRQGLAGGHRRPHAGEGVGWSIGVQQRRDEAGTGEEQRRALGFDQLDDACRRRTARLEDDGATDGERERQRVAEAVGEEQLGDGQESVVLGDPEHLGGVRVSGRLQAGVAMHHALRQTGRAGAVQPERRRVGCRCARRRPATGRRTRPLRRRPRRCARRSVPPR